MRQARDIALISLLAVIIAISGSFKVPSPFPGTEFQLSAPLAVAIAACFGFTRYILAGLVASLLTLLLGTHTVMNVMIAMTFRLVAGGAIALLGPRFWVVCLAGPLGSTAARVVVWLLLGKGLLPLLVASLPGMIFTALTAWPLTKILARIKNATSWRDVPYAEKTV
ncbi:MAG: hypothetical protein ACOY3J_08470 [Bacillota bacterium]|uniref:BioX family protein n=1 Tax=Thermanaerosceptrum fracticalcis TaxID=1712410 RepID=A0A7G6E0J9_THEFR|nr:hypothetical protein [Thermanaerosceptrum fracticalcis]QNB45603.1 hypothetical protein BR63_04285 [Thermanaerosceptrum fracticalcis]